MRAHAVRPMLVCVEIRDLETAQHEAAHVVVGVALGLRLRKVSVAQHWEGAYLWGGYTWFRGPTEYPTRNREAWALMFAAGIAWDRAVHAPKWSYSLDYRYCQRLVRGRAGVETMAKAASALLCGLAKEHARVTRALLERDLTGADIAAMCRNDALDDA